ncbi:hypothetical protein NST02_17865 [Robertmurraya sp. FSL W8-0741]|uniref:hypothetical protein n=1 Tax=Robertmurraya sp. FSL W8-0741 TaxID=2954629 RepID=UPI0030F4BA23
MSNSKYVVHYVNGEVEPIETKFEYNKEARAELRARLLNTDKNNWMFLGDKYINLDNVISIVVEGENEELKLNMPKLNIRD